MKGHTAISTESAMIFGSDYSLICHVEKLKPIKLDLEMELQSF